MKKLYTLPHTANLFTIADNEIVPVILAYARKAVDLTELMPLLHGYRILSPTDILREGDEGYNYDTGEFQPTVRAGSPANGAYLYRRRIASDPVTSNPRTLNFESLTIHTHDTGTSA